MPEKKFGRYEELDGFNNKAQDIVKNMAADKISREISLMIAAKPAQNYVSTDKRV